MMMMMMIMICDAIRCICRMTKYYDDILYRTNEIRESDNEEKKEERKQSNEPSKEKKKEGMSPEYAVKRIRLGVEEEKRQGKTKQKGRKKEK